MYQGKVGEQLIYVNPLNNPCLTPKDLPGTCKADGLFHISPLHGQQARFLCSLFFSLKLDLLRPGKIEMIKAC